MPELFKPENLVALLTLTSLEIVLGIDNIVFIAILCGRLRPAQRETARRLGLFLAMFTRIGLLLGIGWLTRLTQPLLPIHFQLWGDPFDHAFTGRDVILFGGGLFLVTKATLEIHHKLEGDEAHGAAAPAHSGFTSVLTQIVLLDVVFSLDSVITAVGMARAVSVMITAVVISVGVMLLFSGRIAGFIEQRPTLKILALAFLLLIGVTLIVEGCGGHVSKGYIYFAMAFSLGVEMLNLKIRKRAPPLQLRNSHLPDEPEKPR
jgi:predicted tellurium resistance membrane protein TerC